MQPARLAATLLALGSAVLCAQPPKLESPSPQPPPTPTIQTIVRLVVLDVVVTAGRGNPILSLKPSDFTVFEDNKPQHILSVVEHDHVDAPLPPLPHFTDPFRSVPAPLPPNTFTGHAPLPDDLPKTILVLDNLAFPDAPIFRAQLRAFLQRLPPSCPVAIFRIDWQGIHLIQDLTSDRPTLLKAASSQRLLPPGPIRTAYYRLDMPPVVELSHLLHSVPGRINLIWVGSSSMPAADPVSNPYPDPLFPDESLTGNPAVIERIFGETQRGLASDLSSALQYLGQDSAVLRLSRVAVYPVDARGLVGNSPPSDLLGGLPPEAPAFTTFQQGLLTSTCQGLRESAISSGGEAFCGTNDLASALTQAVTTGSHFYTLAYTPQNPDWNGAFRHIRIEVGPALHESAADKIYDWLNLTPRVVYRDGYYARDPAPRNPAHSTQTAAPDRTPRRLLSYSPKGDPHLPGNTHLPPLKLAMNFSIGGPWNMPFHVTITPSQGTQTIAPARSPHPATSSASPGARHPTACLPSTTRSTRRTFASSPETAASRTHSSSSPFSSETTAPW